MATFRGTDYRHGLDAASITLASLASSSTLLVGRASAAIDLTDCVDLQIHFRLTTGTSPTAAKGIELHAICSIDGTTWPLSVTGSDGALTIASAEEKDAACIQLAGLATHGTSNTPYDVVLLSLRKILGALPNKVVFFVTHSTMANANATAGNHGISFVKIQPQMASV